MMSRLSPFITLVLSAAATRRSRVAKNYLGDEAAAPVMQPRSNISPDRALPHVEPRPPKNIRQVHPRQHPQNHKSKPLLPHGGQRRRLLPNCGSGTLDTDPRTERFAVVIGSGEKGQTYLFWDEDQLFQLPVSYWKDLGWVNSPGYRDGFADFERAIIPRCLECHATYFEALPPPTNRYNTTGFSLGIQCENVMAREGNTWSKRNPSPNPPRHPEPGAILPRSANGSVRLVPRRSRPAAALVLLSRRAAGQIHQFPPAAPTRRSMSMATR